MMLEKPAPQSAFSPQYFIINKSEPQYELIRNQLLEYSYSHFGSSHYFIRSGPDNVCVCRIRAGNGTVLFYEIINHALAGISDEEIRAASANPANASPLPDYCYPTPLIEEKIRAFHAAEAVPGRNHCRRPTAA
jgi:hypothetical protein